MRQLFTSIMRHVTKLQQSKRLNFRLEKIGSKYTFGDVEVQTNPKYVRYIRIPKITLE